MFRLKKYEDGLHYLFFIFKTLKEEERVSYITASSTKLTFTKPRIEKGSNVIISLNRVGAHQLMKIS